MLTVFSNRFSNHHRKIFTSFILYLLIILLCACSTTADKMDKLNNTLKGYEKALRWAKFDAAYSFHKWDSDEQPSMPSHLKNIRITKYVVSNKVFDEKTMTAKQSVSISYYNTNNLREKSLEDKQRWKYFPDHKRWYLMSKPLTF